MLSSLLRRSVIVVSCGLALASCSGGGNAPSTPIAAGGSQQPQQVAQAPATTASATVASVSLASSAKPASFSAGGETATLGLYSSGAKQGAALSISVPAPRSLMTTQTTASASPNACATYVPPSIDITNPFPFPIVLTSNDLKYVYILILTKCNVTMDAYNVALNQIAPSVGASTTIGDVKGVQISGPYFGITDFRARSSASYTFAPHSTSQLSFIAAVVDSGGYPGRDVHAEHADDARQRADGLMCSNDREPEPGLPEWDEHADERRAHDADDERRERIGRLLQHERSPIQSKYLAAGHRALSRGRERRVRLR
jgi:hypothetical protein